LKPLFDHRRDTLVFPSGAVGHILGADAKFRGWRGGRAWLGGEGGEGLGEDGVETVRGGGPVGGGGGEAGGNHAIKPCLRGGELGGGFPGGVEAELLVEKGRGAVAAVSLVVEPGFGGVGGGGGDDPLALAPDSVWRGLWRREDVFRELGVARLGPEINQFLRDVFALKGGFVVIVRHILLGGWLLLRCCYL
jgi:hypothetical protein